MVKAEKTTKTDLKAKGLSIYEGSIVDEGEVIDLVALIGSIYGDAPFDLTITRSIKEDVDTEPDEEISAEDLAPDRD